MERAGWIRFVRGLRRWSLPVMALSSVGAGLAASWMVLDPPVLGSVLTGELLAVIGISVLPLVCYALLRRSPRREPGDERAPRPRHAPEHPAPRRPRRAWSRQPARTHAPSRR